jgi:chromosome segregation ATPase
MSEERPEGGDLEGIAKLTEEIDALKTALTGKDDQISKLESIKAELVEARNELKKKSQEALEEQGKYKELYESLKVETEGKVQELETVKSEKQKLAEQVEAIETASRERLLASLPEDRREEFRSFSSDALQKVVDLIGEDKGGAHNRGAARPPARKVSRKFSEMTESERVEFAESATPEEIAAAMI